MIKIGLTGSLASGKTTASKIISKNKGPLFSADNIVKKLYKKKSVRKIIIKKLKLKSEFNLKTKLKKEILRDKLILTKLEKIIHPLVRKEMFNFLRHNDKKKFLFFEIPLLIESKLMNYFDVIIFIKSNKKHRLQRYKAKGGKINVFNYLNKQQMKDKKKMKLSDHIVVNNKSLSILKNKLFSIMELYE